MPWNAGQPVKPLRFDGESDEQYRVHAGEIVAIISGFRALRFYGDEAEAKERRLVQLQHPIRQVA